MKYVSFSLLPLSKVLTGFGPDAFLSFFSFITIVETLVLGFPFKLKREFFAQVFPHFLLSISFTLKKKNKCPPVKSGVFFFPISIFQSPIYKLPNEALHRLVTLIIGVRSIDIG